MFAAATGRVRASGSRSSTATQTGTPVSSTCGGRSATDGSSAARPRAASAPCRSRQSRSTRSTAGGGADLLFPSLRGAYFDLHNFRTREWKPAQLAAGITPIRRVYDLRHTFATFALRAGVSTFDLSRSMGASLTMIDRHYGHLARDGRDPRDHPPRQPGKRRRDQCPPRGHHVDTSPASRRHRSQSKRLIAGENRKPSNGLEPLTPSLPPSSRCPYPARRSHLSGASRAQGTAPPRSQRSMLPCSAAGDSMGCACLGALGQVPVASEPAGAIQRLSSSRTSASRS
jgi:hypothetical protein